MVSFSMEPRPHHLYNQQNNQPILGANPRSVEVSDRNVMAIIVETCEQIKALKETGCLINFPSHLTAIHRSRPSEPVMLAEKRGNFKGKKGIDIGCGHSVDAEHVASIGGKCYKFDPVYRVLNRGRSQFDIPGSLYPENVDFILLIYVLNVLPRQERIIVANMIGTMIKPGGFIIIGLREDAGSIRPDWKPYEDGFISSKGTFQAFFPIENGRAKAELDILFPGVKKERVGRATWFICV